MDLNLDPKPVQYTPSIQFKIFGCLEIHLYSYCHIKFRLLYLVSTTELSGYVVIAEHVDRMFHTDPSVLNVFKHIIFNPPAFALADIVTLCKEIRASGSGPLFLSLCMHVYVWLL